jgi:hypothetical protein
VNINKEQINSGTEVTTSDNVLCCQCGKPLCVRKQVINMALGNSEEMFCLICLGAINGKEPQEVLMSTKEYIAGRPCFAKAWNKYTNKVDCPEPNSCFVLECFGA